MVPLSFEFSIKRSQNEKQARVQLVENLMLSISAETRSQARQHRERQITMAQGNVDHTL